MQPSQGQTSVGVWTDFDTSRGVFSPGSCGMWLGTGCGWLKSALCSGEAGKSLQRQMEVLGSEAFSTCDLMLFRFLTPAESSFGGQLDPRVEDLSLSVLQASAADRRRLPQPSLLAAADLEEGKCWPCKPPGFVSPSLSPLDSPGCFEALLKLEAFRETLSMDLASNPRLFLAIAFLFPEP